HYEVSNFARPGFASRHNEAYWDGRPYLGLGNGAHSYAHPVRRWNVRDWGEYRKRLERGDSPEESSERLDAEATALEEIWLGLRTARGLATAGWGTEALALISGWERAGLGEARDGRVHLTAEGWLGLDGLAVELERARARDAREARGQDRAPGSETPARAG
ncbi:MAG TPA: hypothetical protein VMM35_07905, partial [Longimicrobiales bacterium]|nr:hypothetical protein [Longimicrobiales bacterium]